LEQLLDKPSTYEKALDGAERLSHDKVVYLGNLAIRWEVLGINDPLTHLFQYLERGEGAVTGIEEDLVTDIAERLPKTPFVNRVEFRLGDDDFVSAKDSVSMKSMTDNNLRIFTEKAAVDPGMADELARAHVESQEVRKLTDWFLDAQVGAFLVFESLPIRDQKIAISRVYQKTSESTLEGTYVSLHNPSVALFNQLRDHMSPGMPEQSSEIDILSNQYEFIHHDVANSEDFVDYYVGVYDQLSQQESGEERFFGLADYDPDKKDGIAIARQQTKLTAIYLETIKAMAGSGGIVNQKMLEITTKLGIDFDLGEGQRITVKLAHDILNRVIVGITSVIDRAGSELLERLQKTAHSADSGYDAVSHFGGAAQAAGETYSSGGCPEYGGVTNGNNANSNGSERGKMSAAYTVGGDVLDDFGRPKIGICRISGCPSHGNGIYLKDKTLVGGCDICVGCHKLFKQGKSPESVYADERQRLETRQAKELDMAHKKAERDIEERRVYSLVQLRQEEQLSEFEVAVNSIRNIETRRAA
jgi:hypothetical protein